VIVNGYDMSRISGRKMPKHRRSLGVIFQDFRLIENRSVYENVALAMRVVGAPGAAIRERVPYVLSLVGLGDMMHVMPKQLSGGEQQRVAIARPWPTIRS
jgi:cell division transport system ATP-binding protein